MEPMQWLLVTLAITLIFVVFAINPMQAATDEAVSQNAYLQVRRIASVINLVASAPDGTTYSIDMPMQKCRLLITKNFVKLDVKGFKETSETYGLISPTGIQDNFEYDCNGRSIKVIKDNGVRFEG